MGLQLSVDAVRDRANEDFQFRTAARFWTFQLVLRAGADTYIIEVVDSEIRRFELTTDQFQGYDAILGGDDHDWEQLLRTDPPPFYQDFFGAWFQHDFILAGDLAGFFSHYWAALRLLDLMREVKAEEGAEL